MPKLAEYQIVWSETLQSYEALHRPFAFPLSNQEALYYWLSMSDSFHFCSRTGESMTLRKEAKQRGSGYWYAYKRVGGVVKKKYIGDRNTITLALLETIARQLVDPTAYQEPPQEPHTHQQHHAAPPRQPRFKFLKTLDSALAIYGFFSIPDKRSLITRYRELSMQHHPDRGGLHEDMVAINLAYEYLKTFL